MVCLSAIGGVKSFTSVPYWDMWGPYLDFYMDSSSNFSSWWNQHNEHRIVLAKILFWIDIRFFGGLSYFLIFFNYLFVVLGVWIFFRLFHEKNLRTQEDSTFAVVFKCFIVAWLFSWSQYDNLTWAFQSQFFLAQLLPLFSFYWFSKSINSPKKINYFMAAISFGVLSVGSMANGIFALPLLFIFSQLSSQSWQRSIILFVISVLSVGAYLYGYVTPAGHASPLGSLLSSPFSYVHYVLNYLGSPIYFIFKGTRFAEAAAIGGGVLLLLGYSTFAIQCYKAREYKSINVAIIFFGIYILATAVITGGGRLIFGVNQALTSRYCTPALMMWAGLFIMLTPLLSSLYTKRKKLCLSFFVIASLGLIPMQLKVLKVDGDINFNREVAGLALAMGVQDFAQISKIYPAPDVAIAISEKAKKNKVSIFGAEPYKELQTSISLPAGNKGVAECVGNLDEVSEIQGSTYSRIRGWMYSPNDRSSPALVQISGASGVVVGYALVGQKRDDVKHIFGLDALKSGFLGYVKTSEINSSITANSQELGCAVTLRLENKL